MRYIYAGDYERERYILIYIYIVVGRATPRTDGRVSVYAQYVHPDLAGPSAVPLQYRAVLVLQCIVYIRGRRAVCFGAIPYWSGGTSKNWNLPLFIPLALLLTNNSALLMESRQQSVTVNSTCTAAQNATPPPSWMQLLATSEFYFSVASFFYSLWIIKLIIIMMTEIFYCEPERACATPPPSFSSSSGWE